MRTSTKVTIIAVGVVLVVIAAIVAIAALRSFSPSRDEVAAATPVVAADSHRLPSADGGGAGGDSADAAEVTLVEFLDFECEVCGAVYPAMEEIRKEYAGRVTFVVRYFPIPAHKNSMNAAVAVEAAAQQGQFEQMYSMMFLTQAGWGERQDSQAALFRSFAVELGLDMAAFDAAVADPATARRVQSDFDAGRDLGVQGTPTFFVNDEKLEVESLDDIRGALDAALQN